MQSSNNIHDFLRKTLAYVTTYELAVYLEFGMAHICYFRFMRFKILVIIQNKLQSN